MADEWLKDRLGLGALALTLARGVIGLELLERAVLGDNLLNVRRGGVLDALAGHLAGEDKRKGIAAISDTGSTVLLNGSSALGCSGISIVSHCIPLVSLLFIP